jgi:hypothetical protein
MSASETVRRSGSYLDLEPRIGELARMAEIARFYVSESPLPCNSEELKADRDRMAFAISHMADMAHDLEQGLRQGFSIT